MKTYNTEFQVRSMMTEAQSKAFSFVLYYDLLEIGDALDARVMNTSDSYTRRRLVKRYNKLLELSVALHDEMSAD